MPGYSEIDVVAWSAPVGGFGHAAVGARTTTYAHERRRYDPGWYVGVDFSADLVGGFKKAFTTLGS